MAEIFGYENGGPSAGLLYQDRLVLAGALAGGAVGGGVLAASKTGNWDDFRLHGTRRNQDGSDTPLLATPADGFWAQEASARGNAYHALLAQQGLFVFGSAAETVVPAGPFTATQVQLRENSWLGSDPGRKPVIAGSLAVFLQRGGHDLRGFHWSEREAKYPAPSLTAWCGQVFRKALDLVYRQSSGRRGDTVMIVDENGDIAIALFRVGEQMPAWSRWSTEGKVRALTAPQGAVAALVERNGHLRLERLADELDDGHINRDDCEVVFNHKDFNAKLPDWMEGLAGGLTTRNDIRPLRLRWYEKEGDGVGEYYEHTKPWSVSSDRRSVNDDGTSLDPPGGQSLEMRIGLKYERVLETTQFVRRTAAGSQARLRPQRILDTVIDFVFENVYLSEAGRPTEAGVRLWRGDAAGGGLGCTGDPWTAPAPTTTGAVPVPSAALDRWSREHPVSWSSRLVRSHRRLGGERRTTSRSRRGIQGVGLMADLRTRSGRRSWTLSDRGRVPAWT